MSLKNEAEVSDFVEHLKMEVDKFKDDIKNKDAIIYKLEENIQIIKNKFNSEYDVNFEQFQKLKIKLSDTEYESNKYKQENLDYKNQIISIQSESDENLKKCQRKLLDDRLNLDNLLKDQTHQNKKEINDLKDNNKINMTIIEDLNKDILKLKEQLKQIKEERDE